VSNGADLNVYKVEGGKTGGGGWSGAGTSSDGDVAQDRKRELRHVDLNLNQWAGKQKGFTTRHEHARWANFTTASFSIYTVKPHKTNM
jgi:hypothetical protein